MADISILSNGVRNQGASGTAVTLDISSLSPADGDIMVCAVHANTDTQINDNNGGTGFTEDIDDFHPLTGSGQTLSLFTRRRVTGDPTNLAFTLNASVRWTIVGELFRDADLSAIFDGTPSTPNANGASTAETITGITTTVNNSIHCVVLCLDGDTSTVSSTPSGYTMRQNGGNQCIAFATKVVTAGATGNITFDASSADAWAGYSFAIKNNSSSPPAIIYSQLEHAAIRGCFRGIGLGHR